MEKYALGLGKNLGEAKDSLSAFVNENILFCKLTCELWRTLIPILDVVCPRQNSMDYFESLVYGLHVNSFTLLASSSVHLSVKTSLSKWPRGTCLWCSRPKMAAPSRGSLALRRLAELLCMRMPPLQVH